MDSWDDVDEHLRREAADDLEAGCEMARPCLIGFRGEDPALAVFLRDFMRGEYHAPMLEVLALTAPLGLDRLALGITARAWSLHDPIPPVTDEVDLRQRVLMIQRAWAEGGTVRSSSLFLPFDDPVAGQPVVWGEPHDMGVGEGWIASVLALTVDPVHRAQLRTSEGRIAAQAARLDLLGHLLLVTPELRLRLRSAVVSQSDAEGAGLPWPLVDDEDEDAPATARRHWPTALIRAGGGLGRRCGERARAVGRGPAHGRR